MSLTYWTPDTLFRRFKTGCWFNTKQQKAVVQALHDERLRSWTETYTPADVGDVRSRVALDLLSYEGQVYVGRHLHLPQVDPQELRPALGCGTEKQSD